MAHVHAAALEVIDAVVGSEAVGGGSLFAMLYGAGFRNILSTESDLDAPELSWKQSGIEHTCARANQLIVASFHVIHRIVDHTIIGAIKAQGVHLGHFGTSLPFGIDMDEVADLAVKLIHDSRFCVVGVVKTNIASLLIGGDRSYLGL